MKQWIVAAFFGLTVNLVHGQSLRKVVDDDLVFATAQYKTLMQRLPAGQVLRTYAEESTTHWRHKWAALPGAFDWIGGRVVYHEICVVRVNGDQARVYDPTDGVWLDPEIYRGHGGHIAIRAELPVALKWGAHTLVHGQWTEMASRA